MQEEHDVMNALREADLALARMREGLAELERSLEEQDELTGLISQCMLQVNLGSMQNPLPVTMKLMALNLPVWPDPSKNVDELETPATAKPPRPKKTNNLLCYCITKNPASPEAGFFNLELEMRN